ncbi:MAG: tyrosine-type recombinase/integrase [Solirubrobacteraceae bacterium]
MAPIAQPGKSRKARKPKRLPQMLAEEETRRLMAQPNLGCPTGLRDRCLLQLMHRCGMRISEACAIRLGDVDWDSGRIRVIGKGDKERVAYADQRTLALLERWRDERARHTRTRKSEAPLFVNVRTGVRGEAVSVDAVYKMVVRRMLRVGIDRKKAHPHTLRHTFASDMLAHGRTLEEIRKLMGHTSIRTTEIYLHASDPRLAEALQAIDWGY